MQSLVRGAVCAVLLGLCGTDGRAVSAAPCPQGEAVVREAMAMLDVREATGRNDGPEVAAILHSVGLGEGYSWCGAFVYHTMRLAGVDLPPPASSYAWAPTWTAKRVIWRSADLRRSGNAQQALPAAGDVFGIWFTSKHRVAHVGLVAEWQAGSKYVLTIEGNTNGAGSREGDGVYAKRRLKSQLYAVSRWAC